MLPKVIHYCWFGPNPIPDVERECIQSWMRLLPDYDFKLWNEETFDLDTNNFARQAYDNKYYAFVSDFVRVQALYTYGGIYLDTDVELMSRFDELVPDAKCFLGFENRTKVGSAVMGFTEKHPLLKDFLGQYDSDFDDGRGNFNTITNVAIMSRLLKKHGLIEDGSNQQLGDILVYNREYFYPKKLNDMEFRVTDKTIAIHKCSGSWLSEREKRRGVNMFWINVMRPFLKLCRRNIEKIVGVDTTQTIEIKVRNILK
jgi:mannosyltransferase OCH1-like enzyme